LCKVFVPFVVKELTTEDTKGRIHKGHEGDFTQKAQRGIYLW